MSFWNIFQKKKRGAPPKQGIAQSKKEKKAAAPEQAAAPAGRGPLAKETGGEAHRVLLRPLFTEKTETLKAQGQYAFVVSSAANKIEVARAVRDLYGLKPVSVRIINMQGKRVRFGRTKGKEKNFKKAIVKLPAGQALSLTETA